ncbi:unnamed protein product [Protopolystoma xenopodis]|uniref:DOCKER domain-containing protein n=1 Tax=Protopolystoma xenopodis TaxID=117903 RepID=A0A3S5CVH8_9PLAT|nr:unnamed protein product [Protopolystoma xenopodis]
MLGISVQITLSSVDSHCLCHNRMAALLEPVAFQLWPHFYPLSYLIIPAIFRPLLPHRKGLTTEACLTAPGPKHASCLTEQWKRRTILTTEASFPHLRRRLEVVETLETDLSPIDGAIDAIQAVLSN